ncbi:MAG TPA: 16S rRNA (cytidine(1402)-2'-O)-methyltransferase [Polyangiaceae bacterium]|nr:16S rRNA (cytidine(1402)-2'-O)-methyltransferase [Polyangiaceae bacterium]
MATLFVVGTPIGNLDDLTLRAAETLRRVPHVAAEDTRRTRALLSHLGAHGRALHALDANASDRAVAGVVARLVAGEDVALVTDAGMPAVSDPGARLVAAAAAAGAAVRVVPGPSALTAAVAVSGLVEGPFWFAGFLPRKGGKRRDALERIARSGEPVVLFESPQRTAASLADLAARQPARPAAVCRELTKVHEAIERGTLAELAARAEWRGEVVIVLGPGALVPAPSTAGEAEVRAAVRRRLEQGESVREVAAALAAETGRPRRELYALAQAERDCANTPRPCSRR